MKTSVNFIVLFLLLSSCSDGETKTSGTKSQGGYTIDISKAYDLDNVGEVIEKIEFIPLETNENSLIGEVKKVVFHKDKFYILNEVASSYSNFSNVKVFDKDGKYIRTVGTIGRGPGEYTSLMDFMLDSEDEKLLLLSNNEKALFEYDLEGNYIRTIKNNLYASKFTKIGDTYYYFINQNNNELSGRNNLIVMERSGEILDKLFPFPETIKVIYGYLGSISMNNEGVLYNSPLSDTVFQLTKNNELYPKYRFDFGENALPASVRKSSDEFSEKQYKHSLLYSHFIESKNMIAFTYRDKGRYIRTAYCNTKKTTDPQEINVLTPILLNFPLSHDVLGLKGEEEFISSNGLDFLDWIKTDTIFKENIKTNYPDLYKLVPQLKETDNPILVVYKLKLP